MVGHIGWNYFQSLNRKEKSNLSQLFQKRYGADRVTAT